MKRVLVDQGNGVEIMYPDLYKRLNLNLEDLTAYDSPLVNFDRKVVILRGQIRLTMQVSSKVVEVDFIVVDVYSPYTTIMARPWLYALGDQIEEFVGSQSMARQCLVFVIMHQPEAKSSASVEGGS